MSHILHHLLFNTSFSFFFSDVGQQIQQRRRVWCSAFCTGCYYYWRHWNHICCYGSRNNRTKLYIRPRGYTALSLVYQNKKSRFLWFLMSMSCGVHILRGYWHGLKTLKEEFENNYQTLVGQWFWTLMRKVCQLMHSSPNMNRINKWKLSI